jgi:glycosyltransferase involved in cell wall biosynthesis
MVPELPLPPCSELHVQPPQAQLRELYAQCDAWLFSTKTEGFGLPILEAMACRTPVIATPAGAAPELLSGGGGIMVAPNDPNDMARGIERIIALSDPEWVRLSDLAFETASRYDCKHAAELFEAALQTAIEKQKAVPCA